MSGPFNLRITARNFCIPETVLSSIRDRILYAYSSKAHRGDLDRKKSSLSDEAELPALINEKLPDSISFYYEKVMGGYGGIWRNIPEFFDILYGGECRICLARIFTTGLSTGELRLYGSEDLRRRGKLLQNGQNPIAKGDLEMVDVLRIS